MGKRILYIIIAVLLIYSIIISSICLKKPTTNYNSYISIIDSLEKDNLRLFLLYDSLSVINEIYTIKLDSLDSIININNINYEELIDSYNSMSNDEHVIIFKNYISKYKH